MIMAEKNIPDWVRFPGEEWETSTPEQAGLNPGKFNAWAKEQKPQFGKTYGGQVADSGGVVIARGGYLVHTWGDPDYKFQSASLGKTFVRMALQLTIDQGLIKSRDDLVMDHWTGEGQLNDPKKYLDAGHHAELTFGHLADMTGGFPVTNAYHWKNKIKDGVMNPGIAEWARWTGDGDADNYSHIKPGEKEQYSSGGYWRLCQALTAIWNRDLKSVMDEHLMQAIGIRADKWDWLNGREVRENEDFYPEMPGYPLFLDPPYEINGISIKGGGGWVVMSARDFARLGLLIATGGIWNGTRLISSLGGNTGVMANTVDGWGRLGDKDAYFSFGKVATGFDDPTPDQMASWITGKIK
jgi:CubicO group peptidase (beta-lactamase class C family)